MLSSQTKFFALTVTTFAVFLSACSNRPTKPLVLTEQVRELPVQFTLSDCQIPVLQTPPSQPYEVIAKVKTYGNPTTDQAEMDQALHREACAIGAQAVIVEKPRKGEFTDEISATYMGYSNIRDDTSTGEYAYQIVGLAIRYKMQPSPQ